VIKAFEESEIGPNELLNEDDLFDVLEDAIKDGNVKKIHSNGFKRFYAEFVSNNNNHNNNNNQSSTPQQQHADPSARSFVPSEGLPENDGSVVSSTASTY